MADLGKLIMCEDFYSIQGEGKFIGAPSVFLRLAGCNLQCNGFSYQHPETGAHLGCDTKHVWSTGKRNAFKDIIAHWEASGFIAHLKQGAHLVVTGGEPLIQQASLLGFFHYLDDYCAQRLFIECETNATLRFSDDFLQRLDQINASPKLLSSGEADAYQVAVLEKIATLEKTSFKFVITTASDIDEILEKFVKALHISPRKIWLMPEGGTKKIMEQKQMWVVELAKRYTMNYTTRLHLSIWDEATGV